MLSRIEEIQLIARCLARDDREAFGRLVDAYDTELRRFLTSMTGGDSMLADDLAQETFLHAYTGLSSFRHASRFRTWLFTIATRQYYDYLRSRRMEPLDDSMPEPSVSPCRAIDSSIDVTTILNTLSPLDRSIALLYYLRDMSTRDVAKATGLTTSNVKVRLHRLRALLCETFKNEIE